MDKKDIVSVLEQIASIDKPETNIVEAGNVRNVQVFGKKVDVDLVVSQPSLATRKKLEVHIMKQIHEQLDPKMDVKVRTEVVASESPVSSPIRGKKIEGIKHVIAISSGKGGVGKSTVTTNLAVTLKNMGFKVGILDADIYGPSIPTMFDVEFEKPLSVQIDGKAKMKPVRSYDIDILSIGFFAPRGQVVAWRGPMATKALNQMIHDADWGELDFLLIDLPPGTGDVHLSLVQSLPITGSVIVSTPQKVALEDAHKGLAFYRLNEISVPVLGLIENMAYFTPEELPENKYYIFGENGGKNFCEEQGLNLLGEVPIVQGLRESADMGYPLSMKPEHPVSKAFDQIAKQMIEKLTERVEDLPPTEITRITTMAGCSSK